nr:unnamed protein product [Spirometra erinaceieuropaei]
MDPLRRIVKTATTIFESNRITAAKAKRETSISQPLHRNATAQLPPTCPRNQRTFRAPTGLAGHIRTNCNTRTEPNVISPSPTMPSTNADRPPQPPISSSSSSSSSTASTSVAVASAMSINTTQNPDTPIPSPSTSLTRTRSMSVHIAIAPSPHISAWSVNCESIAQRLMNQCLEHQPTLAASTSTAHIALAHLVTAWVCQATCASTKTCGRQPRAVSHHHILPHQHPTAHQHHPPRAPNCHLPRKWEVCDSAIIMRLSCCICDRSLKQDGTPSAVARKATD